MKNLLILIVILGCTIFGVTNVAAQAQFGPVAGEKIVSLKLGRAASYDISRSEIDRATSSYYATNPLYMGQPYAATYSTNSNSVVNAIGLEAKYFFSSNLALRLSGSGMMSSSPAQDAVEGVPDPTGENYPGTYISGYGHQDGFSEYQLFIDLGVDYYFTTKVDRLFPFVGIQANSIYAMTELFDGYRGLDGNGEVIPSYPDRKGESYGWGGSIVGGVDYYIGQGFFLGVELKVASYMYNAKKIYPTPGVEPQDGYTQNTTFFDQPVLKLGFKF